MEDGQGECLFAMLPQGPDHAQKNKSLDEAKKLAREVARLAIAGKIRALFHVPNCTGLYVLPTWR